MADILIRGMEMPNNVFDCPLNSFGTCNLAQDETHCDCIGDSRPEWCPLIPLPAGHGRLGDLDKLEDAFIRYYLEQERNNNLVFAAVEIKQRVADMIGDWPSIVPAEGGHADA